MAIAQQVQELCPELEWIENEVIREETLQPWILAFERSPLEPQAFYSSKRMRSGGSAPPRCLSCTMSIL